MSQSIPFLGTLPGWITGASSSALAAIVAWYLLGKRKIQVQAETVKVEAFKVETADEADIRDHYAEEVRQLRQRLDEQSHRHTRALNAAETRHRRALASVEQRYQRALRDADSRNAECQREREEDRREMERLREDVKGLRAQLLQLGDSSLALFPIKPDATDEAGGPPRLTTPKEEPRK